MRGARYEFLDTDGECFAEIQRLPEDDSAVLAHFPDFEETITVRASHAEWSETLTFPRSKNQHDFRSNLREHLVILVHGIRTHAFWYPRAKQILESHRGVRVEGARYGWFDIVRFIVPGPWRNGPIKRTKDKIRPLIVEANRSGQMITVICHSNGTQVVTKILKDDPLFEIDNLIMCGSVVDTNYNWWLVKSRVRGRILNDYGTRDVWPAVAQSITWGYGYSGTVGFGTPVHDRIHNCSHSDYFTNEFMRTFWLPLVTEDVIVQSPYLPNDDAGRPSWYWLWELPLRWIIPSLAITIAAVAIYFC